MNDNKRIVKNTMYLFLRMSLVMLVGLFTSRVVLNTLGVEDYGIYNVVGGVVILFSFFQLALTDATLRFFSYGIGRKLSIIEFQKTFSMSMNVHLILSLIVFVLLESFGLLALNMFLFIPEERIFAANIAYQFTIICFCLNIIKTPYNSMIIAHERMGFYAYTSIIEIILKLIIVYILLIISLDKLILYSILVFVVTLIMYLWYYLHCRKVFEECIYRKWWDGKLLREMINYSGWSIVVNGVDVGVNQAIVFYCNIFFGVVVNAALGIANQLSSQLLAFHSSFTQAYNPQIIKSYAAGDKDYFMKLIFSSSKFSYYLLYIISVPICFNIDLLLRLWLRIPPQQTSQLVILSIAYFLVDAYSAPLWTAVFATGNLKTHQLLMSSIKVLNIPLAYLLLKMGLGPWSAIALKVFLNIICSIVRPCYVRKLYDLPLKSYFKEVFSVVYIVTFLTIPVPILLSHYIDCEIQKLIITTIAFLFVSFPIIFYIGMNDSERFYVKNLIRSKFHKLKNN